MKTGSPKNRVALIIGGVLIVLGLWQLLERTFGTFFAGLWKVVGIFVGALGSLIVIAVGVILVVAARKDKLNLPQGRKLYRSTRNKKIAGICGGVAEYFAMDKAMVRIIALVLALVSWYVVIPLYLILWAVVPPDTQSFNTWV
jgi:phage shock protein PspC (stress-responsive transcriptional regulator)